MPERPIWIDGLGVALMGHGVPGRAVEHARAAERAGLGSVWIIEDYFHPGAYTLAAAAAAVTGRVTIGLGVVNPYTRHPALVAMETAALAGVAPGRVVLGLGTSNRNWIEGQMAIPFKTPLRGLREAVAIVRALLAGERVTFAGECFTVNDVALESPPPAPIPILLGVKGPRALALAAEVADGVHASILASPAHVRRVRDAAPGRADFRVVAYLPVAVSDDRREARAWMRPVLARYLGVLHGQSILEDAGVGAERTLPFRDALRAGRVATGLVTDDLVDTFAVAGTPADCRAALARWAAAGLDLPIAVVPPGADLAPQLERLGRELAPAWKEMRPR
ncbi:MAG: LLM class flavin-dependent oxidoreductase [Candidatus Rokubacteria bacterium]|nr:LLM class flavin-dependent oxidoreductase [Candidatus Rokubacteria bacterium]